MKKIINKLKELEKHHKIKILFAVESGSRSWNMHSKDSDYDIRFVYARKQSEYLKINNPKDIIEIGFDKKWNQCKENKYYDILGFDILKFARLLQSSNPSTIEWLNSNIIYLERKGIRKGFRKYILKYFKPISLYYHYKNMCKQNYLKYLKAGNLVTYKKYLYAYRGLVNAKSVVRFSTIPNIDFPKTVELMKENLDQNIVKKLLEIIKIKRKSNEKDKVDNYKELDEYIEQFLADNSEAPENKGVAPTCEILNKIISKVFK